MNPEEHAKIYNEAREHATVYGDVKMSLLLPTDIDQFRRMAELINQFPTVNEYEELVDIESELGSLVFNLHGAVARLTSYYEHARRELDSKILARGNEIAVEMKTNNPGSKVGVKQAAADQASDEFKAERQRISIYENIANEYRNKLIVTKDVFLGITHRLKKLEREANN